MSSRRYTMMGSGGASYSFASDTRVLDWYEADTGVVSKAAQPKFGSLVATGGAVATTTLNGQPVFAFRSASGGYYATATQAEALQFNPFHMFVLVQDVGSAAQAGYFGTAQARPTLQFLSGSVLSWHSITFAAVPAGWHLYEIYAHGSMTKVSIDGGAYISLAGAPSTNSSLINILLGIDFAGGHRCDANIGIALLYEGQAPEAFKSAFYSYVTDKYGVALAAPQPLIDVDPTDPDTLLGESFDIIVMYGQSNMIGLSTVATTSPAAGILYLEGGQKVAQMPDHYGLNTSRLDEVSEPAPGYTMTGRYGPAGAIANPYQVAHGRQVVVAIGPKAGAAVVPAAVNPSQLWYNLGPDYPRGHKLRDSIYGALLAQVKWLQSQGGVVRFAVYYQGEAEAQSTPAYPEWATVMQEMWAEFFDDIGMPGQEKVVFVQIANFPFGANWPTFRTVVQPSAQVAGKFIMVSAPNGPYEADNIHLQGTASSAVGAAAAAAAVAAGW